MTIYKVLSPMSHRESGERLDTGTYFSDEGKYNADETVQTIITGKAIQNVRPAPPPILWRPSFLAGRTQADINLLLGHVFEVVDPDHDDYAKLVEFGVIETKKDKPSKSKAVEGIKDGSDNS